MRISLFVPKIEIGSVSIVVAVPVYQSKRLLLGLTECLLQVT